MVRAVSSRLWAAAVLAGALAAAPASAQAISEASRRIVISGDAPSACVIASPTAEQGTNASFSSQSAAAGQITITQLVDPVSSTPLGSALAIDLPVICNTAHVLTVRSSNGALTRPGAAAGPASGGFSATLPYRVSVDWGGQSLSRQSDAGTAQIALASAMQGTARVAFATTPGGAPLVAGQYTDALIVELAPTN
ncbi:MAG TPA: hypothetical protein VFP14_11290 [Novosphingobium sp.]|nr:hypothetical protein [Novosphingobium sp.]